MKDVTGPEEAMARAFLERGGRVVSDADGAAGTFERALPEKAGGGAMRELAASLGFEMTGEADYWSARLAYVHLKDGRTVERRILWHGRLQTGHDGVAVEEGWYDGGDIGEDDAGSPIGPSNEKSALNDGPSHRLVALFARWSYDHWSELNDGSPQAEKMDKGPDEHDHVLSAAFDHPPSPEEIAMALKASETELDNQDGKSKLVEYAVMDEGTWRKFLGGSAQWFREDGECEFPTIRHHGRLASAREYATRSGAEFTPATA